MDKIIECNNITHYYGDRLIYENINFEIERGKILGLLGKNGTGKTTIINILNGYLKPRSGECKMFGVPTPDITADIKSRIGLLLEGHVQHSYMNIHQIEKYYSKFFPNWKREAYWELIKKLKVLPNQKISNMSCGQQSQVALGLILAQDPELLILDDFSMGLDPGYRRLFIEYLREYSVAEDKTLFLTSHIIQDMELLIDDCMILDYGKILIHKPTNEIMDNFKRFSFSIDSDSKVQEINKCDSLWTIEKIGAKWECYSFEDERSVRSSLESSGVKAGLITSEKLTLEDAFIGLTGKY